MNWKKFFYGLARPSSTLKIEIAQTQISYEQFIEQIKMVVPRPIPRFADDLLTCDVLQMLQSINRSSSLFDHPVVTTSLNEKWSSLPLHKKIMLQILCSIDTSKKFHLVFFERIHLNQQQSQQIYEVLKFLSTKGELTLVVLGDPMILPAVHWVPLLKAPVMNIKATYDIEDDEGQDEDVA